MNFSQNQDRFYPKPLEHSMQRKVYAGDFRKVPWLEIRRLELEKLSGEVDQV